MNCLKGECKFKQNGVCKVDGKSCDLAFDKHDRHCRQEDNKDLCQSNPDTVLMTGLPEDAYRLPFWSCQNICKYYNTCTEV